MYIRAMSMVLSHFQWRKKFISVYSLKGTPCIQFMLFSNIIFLWLDELLLITLLTFYLLTYNNFKLPENH